MRRLSASHIRLQEIVELTRKGHLTEATRGLLAIVKQTPSREQLLLTAQRLYSPAAGGLLFTCNARGTRLFESPDHDAGVIRNVLRTSQDEPLPLAGFFAAGEFGPVGNRSFLHGHTASLVLLRPHRRGDPD